MKRWGFTAFFLCLIATLLGGCAAMGNDLPETEDIQQQYQNLSAFSATADITLWAEGQRYDYRLSYQKSAEGESVVVEAPEAIAGLVIPMDGGKVVVSEQGVLLSPATGYPEGCSPVDCIPKMVELLAGGVPTDIGFSERDDEALVLLEYEEEVDEGTVLTGISLDGDDGRIRYGSISVNGKERLNCAFAEDISREKGA